MKKALSILLSVAMLISMVSLMAVSSYADEPVNEAVIVETSTEYDTLLKALKAATTGQTVKLLKDVTTPAADAGTYFSKSVVDLTLDLNNKTLYSRQAWLFALNNGSSESIRTFTIKNGRIEQAYNARSNQAFDFNGFVLCRNYNNLVIDSVYMTSGNYVQSTGYGGMIFATNNPTSITITVKNSTIIDEADFVEKYADYGSKTDSNQCIGMNNLSGQLSVTIDNSTLLSQYAEPLIQTNQSRVTLKDAHIVKVNSNLSATCYNNAYVAEGQIISYTADGDAVEGAVGEDNKIDTSKISGHNEFYVRGTDIPASPVVSTIDGASIRLGLRNGLRFYTTVDMDKIDALNTNDEEVVIGTIIAPADIIEGEFTHEDDNIDIIYNAKQLWNTNQFVGSIVSIKETNLARNFVARGYAKIGDTYYYSDSTTMRNIAAVATAFIADENSAYSSLDATTKAIVDHWAAANA